MHSTRDQPHELTATSDQGFPVWSLWICVGAALGGLAVAVGAAGTHLLETRIDSDSLDTLETAVRFQMYHAIALIVLGILASAWPVRVVTVSAVLLSVGVVIFCGSLYILALSDLAIFGAVAPVGGLSLMAGWAVLAFGAGARLLRRGKGVHR